MSLRRTARKGRLSTPTQHAYPRQVQGVRRRDLLKAGLAAGVTMSAWPLRNVVESIPYWTSNAPKSRSYRSKRRRCCPNVRSKSFPTTLVEFRLVGTSLLEHFELMPGIHEICLPLYWVLSLG